MNTIPDRHDQSFIDSFKPKTFELVKNFYYSLTIPTSAMSVSLIQMLPKGKLFTNTPYSIGYQLIEIESNPAIVFLPDVVENNEEYFKEVQ